MNFELAFSSLIYEYLLERFHFCYYKYGEAFPSIGSLCREFDVSAKTVNAALKVLREEGYISVQHGKATRVTFRQSRAESEAYARQFIAKRRGALPGLFESTKLLFAPLLSQGFGCLDGKGLAVLSNLAGRAQADDYIRYFCAILEGLQNPLVINLFWEITLFEGFPLLYEYKQPTLRDKERASRLLGDMTEAGRQGDEGRLRQAFNAFYAFQEDLSAAITGKPDKTRLAGGSEEGLPFTWRIYRERPQVCYTLVMRLLHQILMGDYRHRQFLPSYQIIANSTHLPVITVRRTVALLKKLGVVEPINGRGVRIVRGGDIAGRLDISDPAIRRNLAYFFQTLELLSYTCEDVFSFTLPRLEAREREALRAYLKESLRTGDIMGSLWQCLLCIARHCPLAAVREVYGKIYGLYLWGYSLKCAYADTRIPDQALLQFTRAMLKCLEGGDYCGCAKAMRVYIEWALPATQTYLLRLGLPPEELRPTPAIRLMLPPKEE